MATSNLLGISPDSQVAGAAVTNARVVKQNSTTAEQVIHTAAITDAAVGVSLNTAATGELVAIQKLGRAKITAAAAISVGDEVSPNSADGGKIITSSGATARSIGIAREAAGADGDIIAVDLFTPALKGPPNA